MAGSADCLSRLRQVVAISLFGLLGAGPALAQGGGRVALVIGNSDYQHTSRLANSENDASDMAAALKSLGFAVTERQNLDKTGMDRSIRGFAEALSGAQVGLFFYAGHGLQVGGQNYLLPVDAKLTAAADVDFEMVRLDLVQRMMERETTTNIIVMDACRDNPLARNLARALGTRSVQVGRGLSPVESGEGTLISFSTQPGSVALDGKGRNSPFTEALLKHMATPGDDLSAILINVRNDVMQATDRKQVPWEHSAMTARFFFLEPQVPVDQEQEVAFWDLVKESSNPEAIRKYLSSYPRGTFAAMAKRLVAALEKQQQQLETLARQRAKKSEEELRQAREELQKARDNAKAAQKKSAPVRNAADGAGKAGGYQTCGPRGCQWVPAGCRAIRGGGGGGLGGKIVCP